MRKTWQLATLLVVAATVAAAAQRPARAQAPTPHARNAPAVNKPTAETRGAESAENLRSFRGIAKKLDMTTQQLQTAFEQARMTNAKLTRGQFIAAEMLGHNLSGKGITTDAILAKLAGGKSIGQALQSLGLSDQEAKEAEKAADRDVREADKAADKAAKGQEKTQDTKAPAKPDSGH